MMRSIFILFISLTLLGCTNLEERHVFNYTIEGTADYVDDIHVIMGPGLNWKSNEQVKLPVDISHDIYGSELEYKFEVEHSDSTVDVTLKVFIDGELIEEQSKFAFDSLTSTNRITISGVFIDL